MMAQRTPRAYPRNTALLFRWFFDVSAAGLIGLCTGGANAAEIAAPYVPTAPSVVERMLEIAKVGRDDHVVDLGSGDGRIIITAARKLGASGRGIEIDPKLVALAQANAREASVSGRVEFQQQDLFTADLSDATVVTIYLLKRATMMLRSKLLDLRPGTRIVSHAASMGEWPADHFEMLDVKDRVRPDAPGRTYLHYWVVPAKAAGVWRWSMPLGGQLRDYEFKAEQSFQMLTGTVRVAGREARIENGRLTGTNVRFSFSVELDGVPTLHQFDGSVTGDSISGSVSLPSGYRGVWAATRSVMTDSYLADHGQPVVPAGR